MSNIIINRIWQMPNKNTFDIKPIKELIYKYIDKLPENAVIADPFANKNKIANITNDLDPQYDTTHHMDATDFLKSLEDNSIDMILYDPPYCYDNQTSLLTKDGWKNISLITENDEIATRDKMGILRYQKPTYITKKSYVGKMIEINNNTLNLLVTPNHNCLIKDADDYGFIEAGLLQDYNKEIVFSSNVKWPNSPKLNTIIPQSIDSKTGDIFSEKQWYTVELMRFLAFFFRYGETKIENDTYVTNLTFGEISDKEIEIIERTLVRTTVDFRYDISFERTEQGYKIKGKQLYDFLKQFGNKDDRIIPNFIKEYAVPDFKTLLGLMFRKGDNLSFKTKSAKFADDFQEIIIKAGIPAVLIQENDTYVVKILNRENLEIFVNKEDIKEIDFDGKIYCVSVPNMVVLARRDGKVCWCGNSPRQVSECYKNLGQTVNMETTQASYWSKQKSEIGRLVKKGGYVITCSWNSGGIGKKYGFEIVEILLVPHGGWHNDTIVVVERKIN